MTDNVVPLSGEAQWMNDSFVNFLAGLGVPGRDKFSGQNYVHIPLNFMELEAAYRSDWIARKIVQIPAWDMTREWRAWQADPDQIELLETLEKKLFLQQKLQQALTKARLYGGACIIIGVDAGPPEEELDPELVLQDTLKFLHVVSRQQIRAGPLIRDISSKYFGQPEYYEAINQPVPQSFQQTVETVTPEYGKAQVKLHPSRVVKLIGSETADQMLNDSWGDSVLQPVNDAVKMCGLVTGSLATLVAELKVDVLKIPELKSILSTQAGERKMLARFQAANVAKSVVNTIMIDGNEEWQRIQASLTGVPETLMTYMQIAAGAADIPATRFLGMSPTGLNATGESDIRNYYDRLAAEQTTVLTPTMTILDEVLIRSALGDFPPEVWYEWNSLWQLNANEKAQIAGQKAAAYKIDVDAAQIPPVALANARVNQLIEDGFYPGLEKALEDAALEGDTIESENAAADVPPELEMMQGLPPPGQPGGPAMPVAPGGTVMPMKPAGFPPQIAGDSDFDDYNHNHDPDGKFGSGSGGGGGKGGDGKGSIGKRVKEAMARVTGKGSLKGALQIAEIEAEFGVEIPESHIGSEKKVIEHLESIARKRRKTKDAFDDFNKCHNQSGEEGGEFCGEGEGGSSGAGEVGGKGGGGSQKQSGGAHPEAKQAAERVKKGLGEKLKEAAGKLFGGGKKEAAPKAKESKGKPDKAAKAAPKGKGEAPKPKTAKAPKAKAAKPEKGAKKAKPDRAAARSEKKAAAAQKRLERAKQRGEKKSASEAKKSARAEARGQKQEARAAKKSEREKARGEKKAASAEKKSAREKARGEKKAASAAKKEARASESARKKEAAAAKKAAAAKQREAKKAEREGKKSKGKQEKQQPQKSAFKSQEKGGKGGGGGGEKGGKGGGEKSGGGKSKAGGGKKPAEKPDQSRQQAQKQEKAQEKAKQQEQQAKQKEAERARKEATPSTKEKKESVREQLEARKALSALEARKPEGMSTEAWEEAKARLRRRLGDSRALVVHYGDAANPQLCDQCGGYHLCSACGGALFDHNMCHGPDGKFCSDPSGAPTRAAQREGRAYERAAKSAMGGGEGKSWDFPREEKPKGKYESPAEAIERGKRNRERERKAVGQEMERRIGEALRRANSPKGTAEQAAVEAAVGIGKAARWAYNKLRSSKPAAPKPVAAPVKRGRGRPRTRSIGPKRPRGRPRKR